MLPSKVKVIVESRFRYPALLETRGSENGMLVPCGCFAVRRTDGKSIVQSTVDSWQEKVDS